MTKDDRLNLRLERTVKRQLRHLAWSWTKERGQPVTMSQVIRELVLQAHSASSPATSRGQVGR